MTIIDDVKNDPNYICLSQHGFVGLIDCMGSDERIEQAARVSYQAGTRKVSDTRNLLRYLMRNHHWTPYEMGEFTFHMKIPIFIARQFMRHRTFSFNEMSARYSVLPEEYYIPETIYDQSTTNKQGSGKEKSGHFKKTFEQECATSYGSYQSLIENDVSREQARMILPVAQYTEMYAKCNLRNLFHFLKLRTDSHAQKEIQDMANAMEKLCEPKFPLAFEAYRDYIRDSLSFSKQEINVLKMLVDKSILSEVLNRNSSLSSREKQELKDKFKD